MSYDTYTKCSLGLLGCLMVLLVCGAISGVQTGEVMRKRACQCQCEVK